MTLAVVDVHLIALFMTDDSMCGCIWMAAAAGATQSKHAKTHLVSTGVQIAFLARKEPGLPEVGVVTVASRPRPRQDERREADCHHQPALLEGGHC